MQALRTDATRRYSPPGPPPRTFRANATVAVLLGAVAGALNAGGFFAVGVYTSHVTGHWSKVGDELALGHFAIAAKFVGFVVAFFLGAFSSTILIEYDTSGTRRVRYLKPLVLEIVLLAAFVVLGKLRESDPSVVPWLTAVLCFTMGLQNAMVTKISGAVVRTTHMTGVMTDMGIETARLGLLLRDRLRARRADLATLPPPHQTLREFVMETARIFGDEGQKAALLVCILGSFGIGATGGAVAFVNGGYLGAIPIAAILASLVAFELVLIRRPDVSSGILTGPRTTQFKAPELQELANPVAPPEPAPRVETPRVEVETPRVETPRVETPRVETSRVVKRFDTARTRLKTEPSSSSGPSHGSSTNTG
jgi:uncharacterized membrane protein YoaK (UPF0700 family)